MTKLPHGFMTAKIKFNQCRLDIYCIDVNMFGKIKHNRADVAVVVVVLYHFKMGSCM